MTPTCLRPYHTPLQRAYECAEHRDKAMAQARTWQVTNLAHTAQWVAVAVSWHREMMRVLAAWRA